MVIETNKESSGKKIRMSSGNFLKTGRKKIETYFIIVLSLLIASLLLLTFDMRLISGCFLIAAACLCIVIIKKIRFLNIRYNKSLAEYSTLNEKMDDVITSFSHKIREPLNNLVIITDMLMESGLEKKQKELLETFIASTNNMVTTVNELSMQTAGNLSYEYRKAIKFDLVSTIQNTLEIYNLKDNANLDFILEKSEISDYECSGDPIIIKQIFLDLFNTIENQVKDGKIKVFISLGKNIDRDNWKSVPIKISTDKSITLINEDEIEKSLAAKLISTGKGTFNQSVEKETSILNILLPFSRPVSVPKQPMASPRIEELKKKEVTHKEIKDLRILLVEDNVINQKITLLTLHPLVKNIDTASNGKEALDKFGTSNYDLILMDIQMPVMNGIVAAEKIRALEASTNSHIPIIAITANAMIGDREKCLSAGIDDYISKPFQPAALINKIKNTI